MYALIDIDDTIANLIKEWLKKYSKKYNHKLTREDITDWDLSKFTVCGDAIYDFLKIKTLYKNVKPLPYALEGVNALREMGFEIVYVTAGESGGEGAKQKWLVDNGFWKPDDYYVQTKAKFLIKGDLIIDDNYENIANSKAFGWLIDAPWNRKFEYKHRVSGWKEILDTIEKYKSEKNIFN